MEPKTDTPTPPAAPNWWDRLTPSTRAVLLAVALMLANLGLNALWGKVAPGTPPPVIQPPAQVQSVPGVLVLNVSPAPASAGQPVSVSAK